MGMMRWKRGVLFGTLESFKNITQKKGKIKKKKFIK